MMASRGGSQWGFLDIRFIQGRGLAADSLWRQSRNIRPGLIIVNRRKMRLTKMECFKDSLIRFIFTSYLCPKGGFQHKRCSRAQGV
jgi:hypothetical protein